ncbi:MAG: hypothetical protein EPN31_02275 [Castellaniella sp.]|uniref:hypothetical protein n=1 Tax=Castellaniella sp. TaxID=1955812 RepID=UPI0011F5E060|nr:hypothetical protein [Castellaniella sp.]TAN30723.1 MAG: hypothetical protein EPN31_02275 [Castellaniella sp.]
MTIDSLLVRASWWQMSDARLAAGLLGLLLAVSLPAAAWNLGEQIAEPAWAWTSPQEFDLPGVRVRVQHFDAAEDPTQAARRLISRSPDRFARLQFTGPSLRLSGMAAGAHWLADLTKTSTGTSGVISSLTPRNDVRGVSHFDASSLVPCRSAPVISMSLRVPIPASIVRIECPGAERQVLDQLRNRLRLARWDPADGGMPVSGPLARDWRHASGAALSVLSEVRSSGVVLTLWHRESEPRS